MCYTVEMYYIVPEVFLIFFSGLLFSFNEVNLEYTLTQSHDLTVGPISPLLEH